MKHLVVVLSGFCLAGCIVARITSNGTMTGASTCNVSDKDWNRLFPNYPLNWPLSSSNSRTKNQLYRPCDMTLGMRTANPVS
jgi:hypothetical protein